MRLFNEIMEYAATALFVTAILYFCGIIPLNLNVSNHDWLWGAIGMGLISASAYFTIWSIGRNKI